MGKIDTWGAFLVPPLANPLRQQRCSGLAEVILVEACKRNVKVEVKVEVSMRIICVNCANAQQCAFLIMLGVTLAIVIHCS